MRIKSIEHDIFHKTCSFNKKDGEMEMGMQSKQHRIPPTQSLCFLD